MRTWHIQVADTMRHSLSVTQWPDTLDVFCFITYIFAALHITAYLRVPAWFDSRRRQRCIKGKGTTSGPVSWSSCLPWQSKLMARGQTLAVEIKRAQDKVFYPGWAREDKILLVVSNTNTCLTVLDVLYARSAMSVNTYMSLSLYFNGRHWQPNLQLTFVFVHVTKHCSMLLHIIHTWRSQSKIAMCMGCTWLGGQNCYDVRAEKGS